MNATDVPPGRESALRAGMRWLALGSSAVILVLVVTFVVAATSGSGAVMTAAASGAAGVGVAWATGFLAIKRQLDQRGAPPAAGSRRA